MLAYGLSLLRGEKREYGKGRGWRDMPMVDQTQADGMPVFFIQLESAHPLSKIAHSPSPL
jgi:hypothetical protein